LNERVHLGIWKGEIFMALYGGMEMGRDG